MTAVANWGMHSVPILAATRTRGDQHTGDVFDSLRLFEHQHNGYVADVTYEGTPRWPRQWPTFLAARMRYDADQ